MIAESRILDLLDGWRDLPAYQLERRADVFFALYLPRFLEHRFGTPVNASLIPEFPLHLRTLHPLLTREKDDSCRLDYLAFSVDLRDAWFVELKTDSKSRGKIQETNMAAAKVAGFRELVSGVIKIVKASHEKHKYCCLLRLMGRHGLLTIPDGLDEALASKRHKSEVNSWLREVQITDADPKIHLVYLQPQASADGDIGFVEFETWLSSLKGDDLALRFGESLRRWAKTPAGR